LLTVCRIVTAGRLDLSNYLPFLAGANVLMLQNAFPVNPTTWYIATYVHVVLLWALVGHRLHVRLWMLPCAAVGEIAVRVLLADAAGPYVAYMALPNWLTVLVWGTWLGQHAEDEPTVRTELTGLARSAVILAVLLVLWPVVGAGLHAYPGFPFEAIGTNAPLRVAVFVSIVTTLLYVGYPDCLLRLTRFVPAPLPVQFLAGNTLVIFIGHMPVFYALAPLLEPQLSFWAAKSAELLICVFGLGLVSELMFRALKVEALRNRFVRISRPATPAAQEPLVP
jgi:Acyltransferase family